MLAYHPIRRLQRHAAVSRTRQLLLLLALFFVGYLLPFCYFFLRSRHDTFADAARSGEAYVSDADFFDCVGERLAYHSDHPARIPYVLIPVTMDYQDLKQLFCNVSVPMTRIMLINNGEFKPLKRLLDNLEARHTKFMNKSLFIVHHPENIGYASAVNEGFRHAMSFSVEEVPWVFVTNADVRFAPPLIPHFVAQVNSKTHHQEAVIRRLDEEVASEAAMLVDVPDRRFLYRSSSFPVVTATSLPYRIRVMPIEEMEKQFNDTYGIFFTDSKPFMATFAVSRLLLATVGMLDENYYPAYGEDNDYTWRVVALGFLIYDSPPGQFVHYENANINANADLKGKGVAKYTAYTLQSLKFVRMNHRPFRLHYRRLKWFPGQKILGGNDNRSPLPFSGQLPVDMWVLDEERRNSIWRVGENTLCTRDAKLYNEALLHFTVAPK